MRYDGIAITFLLSFHHVTQQRASFFSCTSFCSLCLTHSLPLPTHHHLSLSLLHSHHFSISTQQVRPLPDPVPYFPPVGSEHGRKLLSKVEGDSEERKRSMIVHQVCALQMFQARMDRSRYGKVQYGKVRYGKVQCSGACLVV